MLRASDWSSLPGDQWGSGCIRKCGFPLYTWYVLNTVLTQMSKSSSIWPQRREHSRKQVEEEELSEVEAERSPLDDSDAD